MEMISRRVALLAALASLEFAPAALAGDQELTVEHVPSIVSPTHQSDASN